MPQVGGEGTKGGSTGVYICRVRPPRQSLARWGGGVVRPVDRCQLGTPCLEAGVSLVTKEGNNGTLVAQREGNNATPMARERVIRPVSPHGERVMCSRIRHSRARWWRRGACAET